MAIGDLRALPARLEHEMRAAAEDAADAVLAAAVRLSSGTLSLGDLAAEDHPFARRHGRPRRDPGVLNVQSGVFRASWERTPVRREGDALRVDVWNVDPKARQFLEPGTGAMFARPVDERALQATEPYLERRFARAMADALRPRGGRP